MKVSVSLKKTVTKISVFWINSFADIKSGQAGTRILISATQMAKKKADLAQVLPVARTARPSSCA